jgi:hypothetical protein
MSQLFLPRYAVEYEKLLEQFRIELSISNWHQMTICELHFLSLSVFPSFTVQTVSGKRIGIHPVAF